jgi:hypothetical protein
MKFVAPIGPYRKFGAMGHPSKGTEKDRILSFNLERGPADRLTIQTVARDDKGKSNGSIGSGCWTEAFSITDRPLTLAGSKRLQRLLGGVGR